MASLRVPSNLRQHTSGQPELSLSGQTVAEALQGLTDDYPELVAAVCESPLVLHSYINLFVNERSIRELEGMQTPLQPGDRLLLVPALAGG